MEKAQNAQTPTDEDIFKLLDETLNGRKLNVVACVKNAEKQQNNAQKLINELAPYILKRVNNEITEEQIRERAMLPFYEFGLENIPMIHTLATDTILFVTGVTIIFSELEKLERCYEEYDQGKQLGVVLDQLMDTLERCRNYGIFPPKKSNVEVVRSGETLQ